MYQVSEALDGVISGSGRTFYARLNDVQTGIQRITQTSMSTPDSYMYVGSAISSKIEVSMYTKSNSFKNGIELKFEIGASTGDTIEWIPMGYFTIQDSKKDRDLLTFTAYDRIGSLLGKTYICKLSYPSESKAFLTDISSQTGIQFDMSGLTGEYMIDKIQSADNAEDEDKTYTEPFEGFTMQQVVGYIAQLHGKFAVCDRNGKVVFRWYSKIKIASEENRILDNRRIPIRDQLGDMLYDSAIDFSDDGRLKSTATDFILDQDSFFIYDTLQYYAAAQTYIVKSNRYFDDLVKESSKFEVTGIGCQTENEYITSGESTGLVIESPVMKQEWLDKILTVVKQLSFYPSSFSFMGDPRIDVGDIIVVIDAGGNPIDVPIMEHVLDFDGGLLSEVASYGADAIKAQSPSSEALDRAKSNIEATYARLDKVNIKDGWITNAMIGDAQITSAKIKDLSADKITAGTIKGVDAFFDKSFKVLSPISDTDEFLIKADLTGVTIGTRTKNENGYLYKSAIVLDDQNMELTTKGYLRLTGKTHVSLISSNDIVLYPGISTDDKNVYINNGSTNNMILHTGNFSEQIRKIENSEKLNGMELVNAAKKIFSAIPWIDQNGAMEIGRYLDFHNQDEDPLDFSVRLESSEDLLKITSRLTTVLDLNGAGNASYIKFSGNGATLGWIGLNRKDGSLMLYDSSEREYRIIDETFVTSGTSVPTGTGRKGDFYIQTESNENGWQRAISVYFYIG